MSAALRGRCSAEGSRSCLDILGFACVPSRHTTRAILPLAPDRPVAFEVRQVAMVAIDGILDRVELDLARTTRLADDILHTKKSYTYLIISQMDLFTYLRAAPGVISASWSFCFSAP